MLVIIVKHKINTNKKFNILISNLMLINLELKLHFKLNQLKFDFHNNFYIFS